MRMMFTSPRLENVETVQALFHEAGIETKITGGRSYKSFSRRGFTYNARQSATSEPHPQLWVIRADDYRRAREILLAEGVLDTSVDSYIPDSYRQATPKAKPADKLVKARMALMVVMIGLMVIQGMRLYVQSTGN